MLVWLCSAQQRQIICQHAPTPRPSPPPGRPASGRAGRPRRLAGRAAPAAPPARLAGHCLRRLSLPSRRSKSDAPRPSPAPSSSLSLRTHSSNVICVALAGRLPCRPHLPARPPTFKKPRGCGAEVWLLQVRAPAPDVLTAAPTPSGSKLVGTRLRSVSRSFHFTYSRWECAVGALEPCTVSAGALCAMLCPPRLGHLLRPPEGKAYGPILAPPEHPHLRRTSARREPGALRTRGQQPCCGQLVPQWLCCEPEPRHLRVSFLVLYEAHGIEGLGGRGLQQPPPLAGQD